MRRPPVLSISITMAAVLAALAAPFAQARPPASPAGPPKATGTTATAACAPDATDRYETDYHADRWYGSSCVRFHFTYGPLHIKPGQNDVVITPLTIEKPAYDGFVTRFRPNLVRADGSVPPIEQIHLHHAVWFTITGYGDQGRGGQLGPLDFRNYGNGPFFASGEEKTIFDAPQGYGMPVNATDAWQLLYMVHNLRSSPDEVWVTYDVDYVQASSAARAGLTHPIYPIWLDVKSGQFYPVFNVQQRFGNPVTHACTWPDQTCAAFNSFGQAETGQGAPGDKGTDGPWAWTFPRSGQPLGRISTFTGGSLVWIGGHVHPGGLTDNVDLVRRGLGSTRIFTSEARYWDHVHHDRLGGPPNSWDLSMTVGRKPTWAVRVEPGDTIRISATYDTAYQSTYEDMGIAIAWLAPGDSSGVNPFAVAHDGSATCSSGGLAATPPTLCEKGAVTHGHLPEASHYGGPDQVPASHRLGPSVSHIGIAGFSFLPGNQGTETTPGIPTIRLGSSLTFDNLDAAADIYHSVTSCAYPCNGPLGIAYPLADGRSNAVAPADFDSGELGYGPTVFGDALGPAKEQASWSLQVSGSNGFKPGVYTFFCRIHPSMRGLFAVTAS